MAPFLPLASLPPSLSSTSHLSYTAPLTSPHSSSRPSTSTRPGSCLFLPLVLHPHPITLLLESSPHLATLLISPIARHPPRLRLPRPPGRALISCRRAQDAASVRGQLFGLFSPTMAGDHLNSAASVCVLLHIFTLSVNTCNYQRIRLRAENTRSAVGAAASPNENLIPAERGAKRMFVMFLLLRMRRMISISCE